MEGGVLKVDFTDNVIATYRAFVHEHDAHHREMPYRTRREFNRIAGIIAYAGSFFKLYNLFKVVVFGHPTEHLTSNAIMDHEFVFHGMPPTGPVNTLLRKEKHVKDGRICYTLGMVKTLMKRSGLTFDYEIKRHPRSRHFRVTVFPGGRVLVTIPKRASIKAGEKFLKSKAFWVEKKLREMKDEPERLRKGNPDEYLRYKEPARMFITEKVAELNRYYGYSYGKISIRNQKTRWGSCSSKGNLSFHYRLFFLPREQAEYVIVHELCHLKEMNHSSRFWKLVAQLVPNHKEIRKSLRQDASNA